VNRSRQYAAAATLCIGLFLPGALSSAQESASEPHVGVPQDWTQGHIVFSRQGLLENPNLISEEPRVLHQAIQRWQPPQFGVFQGIAPAKKLARKPHRDWNVALRGRLSANMYPAKYSFDPTAPPDCTKDFVIFGLNLAGVTGGQANLVGFNNLYAGTPAGLCSGTGPNVLFGYNVTTVVGGRIVTSPMLSLDGKKIAFVESTGTSAIFHVLTWTAGQGGIATAVVPTMTSLTFSPAATSTTSSPWVDYNGDIVYLGADDGNVYKITGVFNGTPTLAGAPWPVLVSRNFRLTPPTLDKGRGLLMVGSSNGNLYQINTTTGALASLIVGRSGSTNPGILAAPIVDITNATTFVVSSNDGTSAVLVEADTVALTQLAKARIGRGSTTGVAVNLYQPALSDSYYNNPSTGLIRLCGTGATDVSPWQYAFGFVGRTMQTTASFSQQLTTSTNARCTTWTEFFNPNVGGGTDFFFFSLTSDCTATGAAGGCLIADVNGTSLTKATVNGGTSGIVVDNYSTSAQASSIYLMAGRANTAYKYTQNGLN
jgi:hypothetical protein